MIPMSRVAAINMNSHWAKKNAKEKKIKEQAKEKIFAYAFPVQVLFGCFAIIDDDLISE